MMLGEVAYALGALIFTLALLVVLVYGLKYAQGRHQKSTKLMLKESLFLDTKRRVCVVGYQEKEFMLLLGSHGEHMVELLHTTPTSQNADEKITKMSEGKSL